MNLRSVVAVSRLGDVLASVGLAAAILACGCADVGRVQEIEHGDRVRDERIAAVEKSSAETGKRIQALIDEQQRLLTELVQLSSRTAETVERTVKQLDALDKTRSDSGRPGESALLQGREMRASGAAPRPESAADCRWLGGRTILMLLRDDLIAADTFARLYAMWGCPVDHIGPAFACAVPLAQPPQNPNQNLEAQIDSCWLDLRLRRQ
ncbi:MAG: hypothetical protein ACHQZQ_08015 [SAR324 cluster bacterium]